MTVHEADPGSVADVEQQVWPGDVDLTDLEVAELTSLNRKQQRRLEALREARFILERRGGGLTSGAANPPPMFDLLTAANFILHGEYVYYDLGER